MPDDIQIPKPKRGRPPKKPETPFDNPNRRQYSHSIMERIRERVNPDLLIDYHTMIMEGKSPIWEPVGKSQWRVIQDPNPLSTSPTRADMNAAAKWLTERGYGLPVQSLQVEADFRNKIDQLGTGIPNHELKNINLKALFTIKEALALASGKVIDVPQDELDDNNPLLEPGNDEPDTNNGGIS